MTADALAGAALVMLLARALWQGTEGSFRPYMVLAMLAGMLLPLGAAGAGRGAGSLGERPSLAR